MGRARIIADLVGFSTDSGVITFGDDKEITLTHDPDDGLILKHAATADDSFPELTLQTGDTDIAANDKLGQINFQAPDEGTGTDAILVAASIAAISEGDFSSSSNATKLSFATGASELAAEKMSLSSGGNLVVSGNVSVGGDLDVTGSLDMSDANLTNVGSIQLDSIAGDADTNTSITFSGSDVITIATGGSTSFTANADQTVTFSAAVDISQLTTSSGDLTVDVAGDISLDADGGDIFFKDAGTTFGSATNNSGNLIIKSGTTTAATFSGANVTLAGTVSSGSITSSGNILIADSGTIGSASDADAIAISSGGVVTFTARDVHSGGITIANDGQIGSVGDADAIAISSGGVVTVTQNPIFSAGVSVKNGSTSAGFVEFFEDSDNGTNKVTLIGPSSTSDITLTLPSSAGTLATTAVASDDATALAIALG